jgi:FKBP-type peptidyl-prolyl cis-trans isomerase 2
MARRYASKPTRLVSVSSGEEAVDLNHDFAGKGAGGGAFTIDVNDLWRSTKSE